MNYEDLLTEKRDKFRNISYQLEEIQTEEERITVEEVVSALRIMKNNKEPGPGGLPIELLKYAPLQAIEILTEIYDCLHGHDVPEEWKIAYMSSIHKKEIHWIVTTTGE